VLFLVLRIGAATKLLGLWISVTKDFSRGKELGGGECLLMTAFIMGEPTKVRSILVLIPKEALKTDD
jgi:hypothetical protein